MLPLAVRWYGKWTDCPVMRSTMVTWLAWLTTSVIDGIFFSVIEFESTYILQIQNSVIYWIQNTSRKYYMYTAVTGTVQLV